MNRSLIIPAKTDTPSVILDQENGQFEIEGRSLPEDAIEFYTPIISWVQQYAQRPNPVTELNFKLEYYNSASARKILEIVLELNEVQKKNCKLLVNWLYEPEDELMKEAGEELSNLLNINFQLIESHE